MVAGEIVELIFRLEPAQMHCWLLILTAAAIAVAADVPTELESLTLLYNFTGGPQWTVQCTSPGVGCWLIDPDHCNWYGIVCHSDRTVNSLLLQQNQLRGRLSHNA